MSCSVVRVNSSVGRNRQAVLVEERPAVRPPHAAQDAQMSGKRLGELVRRLVGDLGHVALDDGDDEISTSRKGFAVILESLQPRHVLPRSAARCWC